MLNKNVQIISSPKPLVASLAVSPQLFMALFSLSLRWRSRRIRRGKYIPFVLGERATTLHLQCLLLVPRKHANGQTYSKHKYFPLYHICILLVCVTPCVFEYFARSLGKDCPPAPWVIPSPAWPSALAVASRWTLYQRVVDEFVRAAWKAYRQSEEQVVLEMGEVRKDAKSEGTQSRTESINRKM